jgi:gp45 sliding clamp, C terminal./DNA polymerase processivity factor.
MKLSKDTITILKNYASINSNMLITPGNILKTRTLANTLMSSATVPDTFPQEFGIYDLTEFLSVMALFQSPELEFNEKFVKISEGKNSIKYYSADSSVLEVPKKDINFPETDIELLLTAEHLSLITKTASVLRSSDVSFIGVDGELKLFIGDKKNDTANSFEVAIGNTDLEFQVNFKVDILKFIPGEYQVSISSKRVSRFASTSSDLVYYVGVEQDSTFSA